MDTQSLTRETILETVQTWPKPQRLRLIQEITQNMVTESEETLPRQNTADKALGLLRQYTDEPPPTDEEVERWLEEERVKKHSP